MAPPSYMRSVVDRNVMRRVTVFVLGYIFKGSAAYCFGVVLPFTLSMAQEHDPLSAKPNVWPLSLHKHSSPFYACMYLLPFYHSQYAYEPTPVTYTVPVSNKQTDSVCSFRVDKAAGT